MNTLCSQCKTATSANQVAPAGAPISCTHCRSQASTTGCLYRECLITKLNTQATLASAIRVREPVTVYPGNDLQEITKRAVYSNCLVQNIGCKVGEEFLELSNIEAPLRSGEAIDDVDSDSLKRLMIRRTIEEHLDKELRLRSQGIKVLSLSFINVV
jgi:restriction endonuclease